MADSFGTVRLERQFPVVRRRVFLRVHDYAQADADAVVECLGIGQTQVDATVAAAPFVRIWVVKALIVLPCSIMETNHVAFKRHPI